ncbi:beta-mannosidase [Maniola jurtina]|uniref:beta-mannosidase n=1 Tax=Maniola jurtina TaxID=191418 RepID=UPI001E68F4C1|nr:beta-mannosidase [Maniola jurtina]
MKLFSYKLVLSIICVNLTNIVCLSKFSLDSSNDKVIWKLENKNKTISVAGSVPGGVYSDLQKSGTIGDILQGFNDVLTRWIAYDSWTYTGKFNVSANNLENAVAQLVLEGVDTVAHIELNGRSIGSTNNMFVRYVFNVKQYLQAGENELKFSFESPVKFAKIRSEKYFTAPDCVPDIYNGECHANQIRKMQASFSWDWGPAFPSVGIWRPARLEFFNGAVIRSLTTHTEKKDSSWSLRTKVYLQTGENIKRIKGNLSMYLSVEGHQTFKVGKYLDVATRDDGTVEAEIDMSISANLVTEWWPNGYGDQRLYNLFVFLTTTEKDKEISYKHAKIGFRTIELVEEDAGLILGNNTTAGHGLTFYFKVNGYPIFMKGSNWIPSNILPEIGESRKTINNLLTAARDAHMAMLRVWGGGIYESDYFYRRCDELGILIWQDFLFACSMYPVDPDFLETVKTEIEQNVIRLQHHPSIAVWAGNNENEVALRGNWYNTKSEFEKYKREYITLYVDTIKPIVEGIDPGRRYLVSSPSNGRKSEEDGYIARNPYDPNYGDTHYYNYLADSWDSNIYPQTRFASEYGFQSLPSIKTMRSATNRTEDYHVESNYSKHRQHSPAGYSFIEAQINRRLNLDKNDRKYFEKFVFYSQISQAMAIKTETEFYRQSQSNWYTMGALYWQLNDVWQAPSWSGIEFGGKWKMLHYFAKTFFAPVLISPRLTKTGDVDIYLINDRFVPINDAKITVDVFNWSSLASISSKTYPADVGPLNSKMQATFTLWNAENKDEIFLRFRLQAEGVPSSPYNYLFPVSLKNAKGLKEPTISITVQKKDDENDGVNKFNININVDTVIIFLWLEADSVDGQFEDNGFVVTEANFKVDFTTTDVISAKELEKSITYQYYFQ